MAMEYDELPPLDTMPVVLKDRAGADVPFEFVCDNRTWRKPLKDKSGKPTDLWSLPQYLAAWLLKRDRDKVHVKGGGYEHRFGLAEPTDELVAELGDEVLNTDAITINSEIAEGWDVANSPMPRNRVVYETMNAKDVRELSAMLRERQGGGALVGR